MKPGDEIRELKRAAEAEIARNVRLQIDDFESRTGARVTFVRISIADVTRHDSPGPESVVSGAELGIDL